MAQVRLLLAMERQLRRGFRDPVLQSSFVEAFKRGSRRIFEQQASWEGRRWPPLSARTEEQKGSARIGVETGRLRRSLTERPVVVASRRRLLIGTRVPYAARFDQRRPVLYADPDVLAEAVLDALLPKDRGER